MCIYICIYIIYIYRLAAIAIRLEAIASRLPCPTFNVAERPSHLLETRRLKDHPHLIVWHHCNLCQMHGSAHYHATQKCLTGAICISIVYYIYICTIYYAYSKNIFTYTP